MTMFDGAANDVERRFGAGERFPDILAVGRWVNPPLCGSVPSLWAIIF
jgi:hypothetical protein